ncbi:MAG TPA: hypothetical protein VKA36_04080, partial [Solirubrobacterales bacterium]|nr:hypothetical protein [Solirubrobacterales bacterium]
MTAIAGKLTEGAPVSELTAGRKDGSKRDRGYVPWNPYTKSKATLEHVLSIMDEYRAHWPITNRQVVYRMMGRFGYSKSDADHIYYVLDRGRR